jgi:hypothetical protein
VILDKPPRFPVSRLISGGRTHQASGQRYTQHADQPGDGTRARAVHAEHKNARTFPGLARIVGAWAWLPAAWLTVIRRCATHATSFRIIACDAHMI